MEPETSLHSGGGDTPVGTGERVSGSGLVGLEKEDEEMSQLLDEIQDNASSAPKFSVLWKELNKHLDERAMEIEAEKKRLTGRVKEIEDREREIETKEKEFALKQNEWIEKKSELAEKVERSLEKLIEKEKELRSFHETIKQKANEVEKKEKAKAHEMGLKSKCLEEKEKLVTERLREIEDREREIETKEKEFALKQNEWIEKKSEIAEKVERSLEKLVEKEKELRSFHETIKQKANEVEKKEEVKAHEMRWKSKCLEEKEKLVTERLREIEERERKVELRESAIAEEKEKQNESEVKEILAMERRLRDREMKVGLLEDSIKEKEVELLSKLTNEKSCQLESKVQQFEVKQIVATETDKKEKEVEEKMKELELLKQKNMVELGEGSIQAEAESSKKRSRDEDTLIGCSAKRRNQDDGDKETESSPEEIGGEGDVSTEQTAAITCVVESEFNSFKKTINSFKVNQLWALYDHGIDGMPRLYGRIKAIVKSKSCIQVKWLNPQIKEESVVPVACGRYQYGEKGSKDPLAFSHEMRGSIVRGKNFTAVYPKKGEIWAMFRDWSKSWNNDPQLHKPPYNYDFVEIFLDFDDDDGVRGVYLEKVDGFVSVFKHMGEQQRLVSLVVPPDEMNRFSHKVLFFRLNGDEKGVPVGSFELDPSAVPSSMLKRVSDEKRDGIC